MRAEREIQKKINAKILEVKELEEKLSNARSAIDAFKEAMKLVSKAQSVNGGGTLQPGSMVFKAHRILQTAGKPLHIKDLSERIWKEPTKTNRVSLSSSLAGYVRNESIFTRPRPNTFGLLDFEPIEETEELPEGFGQ